MPARRPEPRYRGHAELRKVSSAGAIKFNAKVIFISGTLSGHQVALEEVDEGVWNVMFYHVLLGRLNERTARLHSGTR